VIGHIEERSIPHIKPTNENETLQKMALQIAGRRELRGVVIKGN
jgi:hypothetical protein